MSNEKQAQDRNAPQPAALDEAQLDGVSGGVDPGNPALVYLGGSRRTAAPAAPGLGNETLVGIDIRPT